MRSLSVGIILLFIQVSYLSYVHAQENSSQNSSQNPQQKTLKSQSKKRTNINFEDQLIRGEAQKPELFYIMQKKQFNFGKLIKLRENFLPEMKKTADDVPRGVK